MCARDRPSSVARSLPQKVWFWGPCPGREIGPGDRGLWKEPQRAAAALPPAPPPRWPFGARRPGHGPRDDRTRSPETTPRPPGGGDPRFPGPSVLAGPHKAEAGGSQRDEAALLAVTRGQGPLARDVVPLEAGNGRKRSSLEPGTARPCPGWAGPVRPVPGPRENKCVWFSATRFAVTCDSSCRKGMQCPRNVQGGVLAAWWCRTTSWGLLVGDGASQALWGVQECVQAQEEDPPEPVGGAWICPRCPRPSCPVALEPCWGPG